MAHIFNGGLTTSIGISGGWPVVKWELEISEDLSVKWLHGFRDTDVSGRLGVLMPRKTFVVDDNLVYESDL